MTENSTQTEKAVEVNVEEIIANSPFAEPIKITRNGVTETLNTFVGKRGAWDKKLYAAVQVSVDASKDIEHDHKLMNALKFIGKENVVNIFNTWLRRCGQDFVDDSIGDEGTPSAGIFSIENFRSAWENLSAAGMKIADLKDFLDEEQKRFEKWIAEVVMVRLTADDCTAEERESIKEKQKEFKNKIDTYRFQLEQRSKKRSKEQAVSEVTA
jgi:hypothetical protein